MGLPRLTMVHVASHKTALLLGAIKVTDPMEAAKYITPVLVYVCLDDPGVPYAARICNGAIE